MDVSVCIVNFNTYELTKKCIESVLSKTIGCTYEVVVIDNNSKDDSADKLAVDFGDRVIIKKNASNRYFSGGFNDALALASGKYVIFLNSDAELSNNAVKLMFDFMEKNDAVGAAEGTIVDDATGAITQTCSLELTERRNLVRSSRVRKMFCKSEYDAYRISNWDRKSDKEVEVICDAFMIARTELLRRFSGFDEALKLYFTEEYLSDKIRESGFQLWHLAEPKVTHRWSSSTKKVSSDFIRAIYKSDERLYFELKKL